MLITTTLEIERPKGWPGAGVWDYGEMELFEVEVTGSVRFLVDNHYGADADGNRGVRVEEVEVEIRYFTVAGQHQNPESFTNEEQQQAVEALKLAAFEEDSP